MKRIKQILLLLMLLALVGCGAKTWQEHYDLGMKYLMESKYEKAILSFTAAIKIDPMQEDAYIYMAEAYQALGEYEAALETLQQGYELIESEKILLHIKAMEMNRRLESDSAFAETIKTLYQAITNQDRKTVAQYFDDIGLDLENNELKNLAYDGTHFSVNPEESALFFLDFNEVFLGKRKDGYPHGKGIYVIVHTWYDAGGISYNWYEGEWDHGWIIGDAKIWQDFSESYIEDRWGYKEIDCTFGEDEIMTNAEFIEEWDIEGKTHRCTYHISDGKYLPSEWTYDTHRVSYLRACTAHADCSAKFSVGELGAELYKNPFSFRNKKNIDFGALYGGDNIGLYPN